MNVTHSLPPIVVAGTGTDIGKTHLTCALLEHLRSRGSAPIGLKPLETGYVPGQGDAAALASAANHPLVAPFFTAPEPVSPHLAARKHGRTLSASDIAAWVRERIPTDGRPCFVETAGGLFSPLSERQTMLDLIRTLDPCVFLLVAPDRLGALHDVTATVLAARALHRVPDAIVLNVQHPNDLDNAGELGALGVGVPVFRAARPPDLSVLCEFLLGVASSTSNRD